FLSKLLCSPAKQLQPESCVSMCEIGESRVQYVCLNVFGASVRWYRAALCHDHHIGMLTGNEPLSILSLNSLPEEHAGRAHYKLCDRLKLEKKQRRMCRRDPAWRRP
ncbi:hypothetical protein INR49_010624, partial [Caranx melampygus]